MMSEARMRWARDLAEREAEVGADGYRRGSIGREDNLAAAVRDLLDDNADLRELIAASKEVTEAHAAAEYERLYDDLRARVTAAMNALLEAPHSTITAGMCPFCGESWPTVGCDQERRMAIAAEHDSGCAKNPLKIERDALLERLRETEERVDRFVNDWSTRDE